MKFVTRVTQLTHLTQIHSCQTAPQIRHETRCMNLLTTLAQIEDSMKKGNVSADSLQRSAPSSCENLNI